MIRALAIVFGLAFAAPVFAGPVKTTEAEEASLRARQVVIRELPKSGDGAVKVLAIVDIQADEDAVWHALLDFPARKRSNPAVQSIESYKAPTATEQWLRWRVSKFGFDVVYHNRYVIDREGGRLEHMLDRSQQNDFVESRGVYDVYPSPAGPTFTRLVWEVETNVGTAIPGFVQKWMSTSATRDFMNDMVRRAEAQAAK